MKYRCPLNNGRVTVQVDFSRYIDHVKYRHDISIDKVRKMIKDPDEIFKKSKSSKEYAFERFFGDKRYRALIIVENKIFKLKTMYEIDDDDKFTVWRSYLVYSKFEEENRNIVNKNTILNEITNKTTANPIIDREYYEMFNIEV